MGETVSEQVQVSGTYEGEVQKFYDTAVHCYLKIMGDYWHHADPDAVTARLPRHRACEILEERVVSLCGVSPGAKVLDFGSGVGGPTRHMAKYTGASYTGVTNNDRLTQIAREKTRRAGLDERVSFQTLDDLGYQKLPFADASFDFASFFESPCHVTDKAALFRELARVLRPGGRLGGTDWLQRPFGAHQTDQQIARFMQPVNDAISIPSHGTVESYKKMMENAGLKVLIARDLYEGVPCWGAVQDDEAPVWMDYEGPDQEKFRQGEEALMAARSAGVFTVGMWIAVKPG